MVNIINMEDNRAKFLWTKTTERTLSTQVLSIAPSWQSYLYRSGPTTRYLVELHTTSTFLVHYAMFLRKQLNLWYQLKHIVQNRGLESTMETSWQNIMATKGTQSMNVLIKILILYLIVIKIQMVLCIEVTCNHGLPCHPYIHNQ